jgi:hypothetical protein
LLRQDAIRSPYLNVAKRGFSRAKKSGDDCDGDGFRVNKRHAATYEISHLAVDPN